MATLGAMLPLMEGAVRVVAPQPPSWLAIYREHPELRAFTLQPEANTLVDTGESRWTVRTDEDGFRVPREAAAHDDRPIAIWLGDSFTFGHGVDYEESFVGLLGSDPRRRFRYINAAVPGYGPVQYRQVLEYLIRSGLRPSLVLVGIFLGNDFYDCIWSKTGPVRDGILGDEGGARSFLKRHSHLYRLGAATVHRVLPPPLSQDRLDRQMADPRSWDGGELREAERVFREELARILALSRSQGFELAVLVIPRASTVDAMARQPAGEGGGANGSARPLIHAVKALEDLHVRFLDLTPVLTRRPVAETYFRYDGHFTPRGHSLAAEAMREAWGDLLQAR